MEWGDADERVTIADVLDRYKVSESTLTRRRKAGRLPSAERTGPGRRWTFTVADIEHLAADESWPVTDQSPDPSMTDHADKSQTSHDHAELGQLRATVTALEAELSREKSDHERTTAERDRARSDHEHERQRADAAERASIEHRTRADTVTEHRDDLAQRLDRLETTLVARLEALEATTAHQNAPDAETPTAAPDTRPDTPDTTRERPTGWLRRTFGR